MNFGELKTMSLAYVPQGKASAISDTVRGLILNAGVADIALRVKAVRTYGEFNSTDSTGKYNLSANLTRYLGIDEGGVWYNDGSGFRQLDALSIAKMKNSYPNFISDSDLVPQRYYILGDDVYVNPGVETGSASAFRIYFIQRPIIMSADGHYPFHKDGDQATETERLEILSESLLLYAESRILKILGMKDESITKYTEYLADLAGKETLINGRPDISASKKTKFQGPKII